jgi:hypothetical protein
LSGLPVIPAGVAVLTVDDASELPEEGALLLSPEDALQTEVILYSGVNYTTNVITLVGVTAKAHNDNDEVVLVDVIEDDAETGQNFFQISNFPVVDTTLRLWLDASGLGNPVEQVEDVNFVFNRGTGQIEFIGAGVPASSVVVANYAYYTALIATVQKVIDGDPNDEVNFPGIRAAGVRVYADTPIIRRINVRASITAAPGVQENTLIPQVQETIESYINGLGIGDDVVVAEIVERAMRVDGMFDVTITLPTSNVVILENELPRPYDINGNTLVVVT